jgi:hypothetical protein
VNGLDFWTEFLLGILLFIAGVLLRPLFNRILKLPSRFRRASSDITRIWTDHEVWVERHHRAYLQELTKVDEDLAERGVYQPGSRLHERVRLHYLDELQDNQRQTFRALEDATFDFGPLERLWLRFKLRKGKDLPPSLEEKVLGSVFASENQDIKA